MKIVIKTIFSVFILLNSIDMMSQSADIGVFSNLSDIGSPAIVGKATYSEPGEDYRLGGSGANIWFKYDSFSFLWKEMSGDFIIQSRVNFLGEGHEPHRKTGLMIRSSKATDAAMVAATIHGDGLTALQWRSGAGENVQEIKFAIAAPDVIMLEKKGNTFTMSVALFGQPYQEIQKIENLDFRGPLMSGIFICAHSDEYFEEVSHTNVRIFNTAPDGLIQYRDYIGSLLEVLDVNTGQRQVLAEASGSWQAPNWTPDGKSLIYNSEGLLYNFDLRSLESTVLNTGFANRNNNDHVLSIDGQMMGISHHSKEDEGNSVIYTLPVTGSERPVKVTENSPSYLHGWSPNNKYLIYTGIRDGVANIYRLAASGGKEKQLTATASLDDGSEYSPDGKYIYFNSARTGTMELWRMDANGSNQIQLTSDEYNNWFPHVSPDNKMIVFLSFPKEVAADQHPFYERVYIRIMPVSGGPIKTIAYLYGGQGTINVPSWSPDSKRVAFISNGIF